MSGLKCLLCVDQFGEFGGGQAILRDVVAGAIADGIKVHVALPSGPFADEVGRIGAEIHLLALPSLHWHRKTAADAARFAASVPMLVRAMEGIVNLVRPDLVHVNGGRVLLPAALARGDRPLAFHAHTAYVDGPSRLGMAWALRRAECRVVIAPSPFMRRWAHEALGVPPERLAMVWNWVDDRYFIEARSPSAPELGRDLRIVVIGRITPVKGQDVALAAFRMLPEEVGRRSTLAIRGPADNETAGEPFLQSLRAGIDGDDRVTLEPGFADSLAVLESADLCVVPSLFDETFGLVAAEAMAAGVPVIVSDRGALSQVVDAAGLIVPAGDAATLASVMAVTLGDAESRERLSRAGTLRARQHFRRRSQVDNLLRTLRKAASGPGWRHGL